ncbi:MAG: amidohydrolase [Nitrososphaerota archaeon]
MSRPAVVLTGCRVYTSFNPPKTYDAIAWKDGFVVGLGTEEVGALNGDWKVFNMAGKAVIPAMTDHHIHFVEYAAADEFIDLRGVKTKAELLTRVRMSKQDGMVYGAGWDDSIIDSIPSASELESASGGRPVFLERVCGHLGLASTSALKILQRYDVDPFLMDRDGGGNPTGVVRERAVELLRRHIPKPGPDRLRALILKGQERLFSYGLGGLDVIAMDGEYLRTLAMLKVKKDIRMDIRCFIVPELMESLPALSEAGVLAGLKVFVDGSLGGGTAALRQPYSDRPGRGLLRESRSSILKYLEICDSLGLEIAFHAIGDEAVQTVLDAVEDYGGFMGVRIEHASMMDDEMIERAARLGVTLSVQPMFAVSDRWLRERVGERFWMCYRWKSMLEKGCSVVAGSDAPVETPNPFHGLWAAVHGHINPDERVDITQALEMYLPKGATGQELLAHGSKASLVALDRDPLTCGPENLKDVRVVMTVKDGEIVYSSL